MGGDKREKLIDFDKPSGTNLGFGDFSGEIETSEWTPLTDVGGVRYRTWKYKEIDDSTVDGALVEV